MRIGFLIADVILILIVFGSLYVAYKVGYEEGEEAPRKKVKK